MGNTLLVNKMTPIEITLDIDETGHTTAKKLYAWLELRPGDYARWVRKYIEENIYAENGVDYSALERRTSEQGGRPSNDYLLTASFAKKLAMATHSAKGEEARNYFIKVEDALVKIAEEKLKLTPMTQLEIAKMSLDMLIEQEKRLNAIEEKQISVDDEIKEINAKLEKHQENWYTIAGYASLLGMDVSLQEAGKLGRKASKIAKQEGIILDTTPDPRYGTVNVYPRWILEEVFSEY